MVPGQVVKHLNVITFKTEYTSPSLDMFPLK